MSRASIQRKLRQVNERLLRAREELGVLQEQLLTFLEVADDTRVRSLVSDDPSERVEHHEASKHAEVMTRSRDRLSRSISELERLRDELLDRLLLEAR